MTTTFLHFFAFQRIITPIDIFGWLVWFGLIAIAALISLRYARPQVWDRKRWLQLAGLAILVPISIALVTVRLPSDGALPIPDLGAPALGPLLAPLVALPWVIALIWFGAVPAVALAGLSGLMLATWDTRSLFSAAEFAILAAVFIFLVGQRYRTALFNALRQPVVAALAVALIYPFLYLATSFFWVSSSSLASFDFALSRIVWGTVAFAAPLLLAAGGLQIVRPRVQELTAAEAAQPAPGERSLEARLLFTLAPVVFLAFLALGALVWWNAGDNAEQLFADRIASNLEVAAGSVPFLLETGQNLTLQLAADTRLADPSPDQAHAILQTHLNGVPYFEQITLLDTGGNPIAGVPLNDYLSLSPAENELTGVSLAIQGVALQIVSVPPADSSAGSAQIVFISPIRNSNGQVRSVLVARTTLSSNPFAQPIAQSLQSVDELGAQGLLLDNDGRIVMAPVAAALLQPYNGSRAETPLSYNDVSADGSRLLVRYQPVPGSNWAAVARWPARLSQQQALNIALPILGVLTIAAIAAYLLLRLSLRSVSRSLQTLATETQRIAAGDLKAPLSIKGADEVGRLGSTFETMRRAVLSRTEETQRLLALSQGLSSSLEVRSHIDPILDAALAGGANVARLVFSSQNGGSSVGFGKGEGNEKFESLDSQMLALTQAQERVLLSNPARARIKVERGTPLPESVAAFALKDKQEHLGALWLAYDQTQAFHDEAVRYLEILAGQASAAAANARLYVTARLGQQRLEGVLMADPQAILLLDSRQNLVFANAEAARVLNLKTDLHLPQPLEGGVANRAVVELLRSVTTKPQATEIEIDKASYTAMVTPIWSGPDLIGFSCALQDVTRAKAIESSRLEFLSTVGHDLKGPLELIGGYLSMLVHHGVLNEQQNTYIRKIEQSVQNISRFAASLLAADRLEGAEGLQLDSFALRDLLASVIEELAPRARQKRLQLIVEEPEGTEKLLVADRTLLRSALHNLLDNAVKFSPRAGKVVMSTAYTASTVTVAIKDSGGGIAPVDLPRLFERPSGLQKAATGLAIVRSIVERHKGKAWAESELGAGSAFFIQIPLQQTQKVRSTQPTP